ncbi:MAG: aldehyde ferredoxin oxidoreductase family protein [Acidobacteria bacterium]|nr:aldehyde ferredoxin oxidoreductase family protein [Acidobacteriota bacterium]
MPNGYNGKILIVDLTKGKWEVETPDEKFYRTYMGGSALNMYYALKLIPKGADPLGPDNVLCLSTSIVTGVPVSGQSRMTASAKSPMSGGAGDSQCGGFFPAEMKAAGYDAIILKGKSPKPVYLWIKQGEVELRDASKLWGKVTGDVEQALKEELGDKKIEIAQIGPAGEKMVRYAAIMNMSNRANGRTGMGAVMGSKNLKAVVVRGKPKLKPAHMDRIRELAKFGATNTKENPAVWDLHINGTCGVLSYQQQDGGLPTRNYNEGQYEDYEKISGETMTETILKDRDTCYACGVRCKRVVEVDERGYKAEALYGGPEYETIATHGSYCGIKDLAAIAEANQICNMYGLDTIQTGTSVAWAMECYERGMLSKDDLDGIDAKFGNAKAMVALVNKIARREGIGDLLAEGSKRAAAKVGKGSEDLCIGVKGQDMPAHMPQAKTSLALIYAVNAFGADHQSSEHDPSIDPASSASEKQKLSEIGLTKPLPVKDFSRDKVHYAYRTQSLYSVLDSVNLCQFVFGPAWQLYGPNQIVELVNAVTGWDTTIDELLKLGERRIAMMQAFNSREGLGHQDNVLPKKIHEPLKGKGPTAGSAIDRKVFDRAVQDYYEIAGWDKNARPTHSKLHELGVGWVAEAIGAS